MLADDKPSLLSARKARGLAEEKHSSLFGRSVNDEEEKFYEIDTRGQSNKTNTMVNYHGNFNPTISRVKILW